MTTLDIIMIVLLSIYGLLASKVWKDHDPKNNS